MIRGAIILCGGRSRRMKSDKATLPFGAETMLRRVVRQVGEIVTTRVVVAEPGQTLGELPSGVKVVYDRRPGRGPLEGLAAGLCAIRTDADVVFASGCDAPFLVPAFVERMFDLLGEHDIAVPTDGEHHHPLAAVYRVSVLEHVERLLAADRLRTAFLFDNVSTLEVPVDQLRIVDPELSTLANINRPEDYRAALRRAGLGETL